MSTPKASEAEPQALLEELALQQKLISQLQAENKILRSFKNKMNNRSPNLLRAMECLRELLEDGTTLDT